jgi:hypothetical protein
VIAEGESSPTLTRELSKLDQEAGEIDRRALPIRKLERIAE